MTNTSKRVEGAGQELGGKIKATAGKLTGSKQTEAEGRASELKGKVKRKGAKASAGVKGKVEDAASYVKAAAGDLTDET